MIYYRQKWFSPPFTTSTLFMLWKEDDIMVIGSRIICWENEQILNMRNKEKIKSNWLIERILASVQDAKVVRNLDAR